MLDLKINEGAQASKTRANSHLGGLGHAPLGKDFDPWRVFLEVFYIHVAVYTKLEASFVEYTRDV
jgi:hypothetical protein